MAGQYPEKIRSLPLYDGRFDAYKLAAQDSDVLFASYPAGTSIPPHTHETDNYGVITRGALILSIGGATTIYRVGDWYHVPAGPSMPPNLTKKLTKLNSGLILAPDPSLTAAY